MNFYQFSEITPSNFSQLTDKEKKAYRKVWVKSLWVDEKECGYRKLHQRYQEELSKMGEDFNSDIWNMGEDNFKKWIANVWRVEKENQNLQVSPELRPYVNTMQIIGKAMFNQQQHQSELTQEWLDAFEYSYHGFNDPNGDKVDLLAQWFICHEIKHRATIKAELKDIDMYFAFKPWEDDGELYKIALQDDPNNQLRVMLLRTVVSDMDNILYKPEIINISSGVWSELNVPWKTQFCQITDESIKYSVKLWEKTGSMGKVVNNTAFHQKMGGWRGIVKKAYEGTLETKEIRLQ